MAEVLNLQQAADRYGVGALIDELRQAYEKGEVESVAGIVKFDDGSYTTFRSGVRDRHMEAGELLEMAIRRLNEEDA